MLRNTISKRLLGAFINNIKKGNTENHCALSLLLTLPENCAYDEKGKRLDDPIKQEFWDLDCDYLIASYENRKNWQDVIDFALKKID